MRIDFTARQSQLLAADHDARQLAGVAVPYGVDGNTSAGRVTVDAGAIRIPDELRRVKLFSEHGRVAPVGYTTAADDTPDRLHLVFHVAATPAGDTALLEAAEGVRDALSVELDNVTITGGRVTAADLVAVALTAVPAYADARLAAADTPPEEGDTVPDAAPLTVDASAPEPAAVRAAAPTPILPGRSPRSLSAIAETAGAAIERGDTAALTAALADITWTGGAGATGAPPQSLGELWTGVAYQRKFVPATAYSSDLSSMTVGGYVWNPKPTVANYAGDKAAVPSTAAAWQYKTFPAQRIAGANDVDRAYDDLKVSGFWEAYWAAMAESYAVQSDDYTLGKISAAATAGGTPPTAFGAIVDALVKLSAYGGQPKIAIAANLVPGIAEVPASDVPWVLSSLFGNLSELITIASSVLADDRVLAWNQNAVTTKEAGSVPIRVQAVNIPNGGIDAALFGYIATFVTQPAAVLSYVVTPAAPLAAAKGK